MAGAAVDATELAKKIATLPELPFNDGYVVPDFSSSQLRLRDPNVAYNYYQSIEGSKLYNFFDDERKINEFYEMYVDPTTRSLAKFYFFNQILGEGDGEKNKKIHDQLYARINHDIRMQLIEPESDLNKMFMHTLKQSRSFNDKTDAEKLAAIQDKSHPGLRFVANFVDQDVRRIFLQELGKKIIKKEQVGQGGKRHSKFKRKSKKVNRKKSRRRHRRAY